MLKKFRKNKKGFTLIELIIVIVILCILAAAAIPSMIGFIDQANGAQYVAEARQGMLAAQTIATKYQLTDPAKVLTDYKTEFVAMVQGVKAPGAAADDATNAYGYSAVHMTDTANSQIDGITYKVEKYTIKIENGNTTITKN